MAVDVVALQRAHPEWNIQWAIEAPGGGIWAMGRDGGIFALDGAPFLGSYPGLAPAARQGTRHFVDIRLHPESGGYTLVSNIPGQTYTFQGPGPVAGAPGGAAPETPVASQPGTPAVDAANVTLTAFLKDMGLGVLVDKAWEFWKTMGTTADMTAVNVWLRDQPEFKAKFPAMEHLESKGVFWTPADYLQYANGVKDRMRSAGIPSPFWDDDEDIATLIRNDWSLDEVDAAVTQAENAVLSLPPEVRAQMDTWGLTNGDMVAFWLDPDKGMTLAERKQAETAAGVATAAPRGITGAITQEEATGIVQRVGPEAAVRGFEQIGAVAPLFEETLGEERAGEELGREEALGFVGGTTEERTEAGREIERRRQRRQAAFSGGGGAAGGGAGRTGLGSAR